ncbi:hypothetical protein M011DRAFT_413908 [Sporormia fimetaria CBS 119925]|uniref:Uncharacterized protein n=1 Tax=Sporormia fimetaria CBS 119925 TaxID=1340428 RepID=A0A6A6UTX2_9PLEO|nr:hypothetical protein M011DRAFT_413908 [Sporormia fimetaria CBS 119925]
MPYTRGGFRSSRSWVSPEQRNAQEFTIVRNCMRRLFKNSEVSQWKHDDYLKHRQAMVESDKARLARKLKAREEDLKWRNISAEATGAYAYGLGSLVHGCLHTVGNRSLVLGEQTIWCLDWTNGKDEIAPWPTGAEMKWEGDDRAKTNVGRFLPLPRERTPGCAWADWLMIKQYPLDEVARVPTLEDIYLPVDEIDDEVKYDLITKDLEDAMNDILKT